ncbi:dipeptide ABC transporter ATP-binding protein [Aeromicrobium choanae]|uniref:Peptide/nickel transport system ATP-binding protein n=1 Tax=Aeromicrobium choanae TaxID=1736691 RepID=A0A1T4YVV8_9ACTN|nr:ABC transporter ATP-binding protein [Aeromicrobium choanae]SKB05919.1 peptide/nickel transport system ATP-binding protein [Aeromicrobium choanae]
MTGTDTILAIRDLSVTYRRDDDVDTALDSVSLDIPRGAVTAIIGESGSGKSTLAHAIVRLLPHNGSVRSGAIALEGEDVLARSDKAFRPLRGRQLGFVPQDPIASLNPTRTIGHQLREAFTLAKSALTTAQVEARIAEDLRDVGFERPEELLRRYPHELSGGMRQRILVAMAFSQRPQLVIADEPTSALDVLVGQDVLRSIHEARRKHASTVVLITHDLALATHHAEHVIVLERGRVVESGLTAEVFAAPQHRYTRELLASSVRVKQGRVLSIAEAYRHRARRTPAAVSPDPAIRLTTVRKRFGDGHRATQAVDGVSLEVPRGSTFALVGESGSGKTTTSRMILGLERPDTGRVDVLGRDVGSLDRRALRDLRREVQIVYQSPFESLNPRLSVGAIVAEPLDAFRIGTRRSRRERAAELLDLVRLPSTYADRRPRELSGGQRQRVAIARALALQPRLLVLDEPVSALDATIQAQVLELLGEIQREFGLTYFLVTHDLAVVADVADRVAVMRHGRLVEQGATADVVLAPDHDYTKALLAV